jgi:hypothetical protein
MRVDINLYALKVSKQWHQILFCASILAVVLAYGVMAGQYKWFPYSVLKGAWSAAVDLKQHWRMYAGIKPTKALYPARFEGKDVVINVAGKAQPVVTLITGNFDGEVSLRLIGLVGKVLNRWSEPITKILTDLKHVDGVPAISNDWLTNLHGTILFPNGDVAFNFDGYGMVRMDACGSVAWKVPRMTHHSAFLDEDQTIWVPGRIFRTKRVKGFPNVEPPFWEDTILQISADGEVLQEISVLKVIFDNDLHGLMFQATDETIRTTTDPLHLNDIEILSSRNIPAGSRFKAGDALLSLRNLNLLMIVDLTTKMVIWHQTGPWVQQHDADFLPDGRISVFDNRRDNAGGKLFGGSRILAVDPSTGETTTLYRGGERNPFYTETMGKHQVLENGNILITETEGGRAFEVDSSGNTVWSYVNRYSASEVAIIEQADRYPEHYADFKRKTCK